MADNSERQRHAGSSGVPTALARALFPAMAGAVLTSCVFGQHPSAPAPTSSTRPGATSAARPQPSTSGPLPSAATAALSEEFKKLESSLGATMGIVISTVGTHPTQLTLGDWTTGPAWSTSKVPLTITALGEESPPTVTDEMRAAITKSDNAAAEAIWEKLGDPVTAEHKMEAVLRKYGDPTPVEPKRVRPEYTAFGQTMWPLRDQARFTAGAVCDSSNEKIFALMSQVEDEQSWGLGTIPDTQFKGGWGPDRAGSYLVRQLGILKSPAGLTVVTVATQPRSGAFGDGTHELTEVAKWLTSHRAELPAGHCGH